MARNGSADCPDTRSEELALSENSSKTARQALIELRETARALEGRQSDLDAALVDRDRAIASAAAAGLTRRRIATVVGLSAARVQQICDAAAETRGEDGS